MMEEIQDNAVAQSEVVTEILANPQDEIVALFCSYKSSPDTTGDDQVEISRGGEPFYILKAGQYKKVTRASAQWHAGKCARWDTSNPLTLSIKTMEEIDALKAIAAAKKHADADKLAQAAKDAKAAQDKLDADAAAAAILRRNLLDAALTAGVIKASADADELTNQDLTNKLAEAAAAAQVLSNTDSSSQQV